MLIDKTFILASPHPQCSDLVESWSWGKNESLEMRKDVNQGMAWVVTVTLKDMAALEAYLPHPQHMEVKKIQGPMVDSIFVVDTYV